MKPKGAYSYGSEFSRVVLNFVELNFKSTSHITKDINKHVAKKMNYRTVLRFLEELQNEGKIKCTQTGRVRLWCR